MRPSGPVRVAKFFYFYYAKQHAFTSQGNREAMHRNLNKQVKRNLSSGGVRMTTESSFRKLLSYQTINTFMKKFELKVQVTKTELNDMNTCILD